jgi:hypothetical protein
MNKMKPLFLAVPMVLALAAGGCVLVNPARFQRTLTNAAQPANVTPVRVSTENGYIRITRSTTGKVEVSADAALTSEARRDAFAVRSELREGSWVIEPLWPDGKALSSERCAFTIAIPDASGLTLETSNGEISFGGFSGSARARTSNGAIRISSHAGPVEARTSNGRVEVLAAAGPVVAGSTNGAVVVELAPGATGPVDASTSNGSIDLTVPGTFQGAVSMETSNGSVSVDGPIKGEASVRKTSGTATFGAGSPSTLKTSNGSIRLRQAQGS